MSENGLADKWIWKIKENLQSTDDEYIAANHNYLASCHMAQTKLIRSNNSINFIAF